MFIIQHDVSQKMVLRYYSKAILGESVQKKRPAHAYIRRFFY